MLAGLCCCLALLLSACARTVTAPPSAPAQIHDHWPGCRALGAFRDPYGAYDLGGRGAVPSGFVPVAAIACTVDSRLGASGQRVQAALERRATDLDDLLTYLARPGRRSTRPARLTCPAMGWNPPWLFLVDDAGRWVFPALPVDPCGFPLGTFDTPPTLPYLSLEFSDTVVCLAARPEQAPCR